MSCRDRENERGMIVEWIPIRTKLPDYGERVLIVSKLCGNWGIDIGTRVRTDEDGEHYETDNGEGMINVVYWMPLPEEPR